MMETFNNLEPLLKAYWLVAIPVSLIFAIQTIMTFLGTDATDGLDADFDGDLHGGDTGFQLFSFRNLTNFLLGFGWTGISFYSYIKSTPLLIGLSVLVGALFVGVFFIIIRQVQRLSEDNSFKMDDTLNKTADVYLTIPGGKSGKGKVMISVKGSYHELAAMTEHEPIPSGSVVKVVRIETGNILMVEPI